MPDLSLSLISPYYPRADGGSVEDGFVGGVEVAIDSLSRALAAAGARVTVYSTATENRDEVVAGVRHVRVKRLGTLFRTPLSRLPWRAPLDADIVQAPATYPFYSDVLLARARQEGVPTVLDFHFDPHPTGPLMAAAASAYFATLGQLTPDADRVLVKSLDYAAGSPTLSRVPPERIREIPNGVDVDAFHVSPTRDNYVVCVGRLVPYKGVDVLLRAMAIVQRQVEAPVYIAGTGPLRAELESLARKLRVDARFLGYVPQDQLPTLYARARLTALPSVNGQEAFGICLLESMASGTPVVASALPGVRQVAAEGGIACAPPGDPDALAQGILRILNSPDEVPTGAPLRERIRAKYGWRAIAERTLNEYRELLEETPLCASSA